MLLKIVMDTDIFMTEISRFIENQIFTSCIAHAIGHMVRDAIRSSGIGVVDAVVHVEPDKATASS